MKSAYTQYFQKSKVFLYPLLDIKKGEKYVPAETYIGWDTLYIPGDYKFICIYNCKRTVKYKLFEDHAIKQNKHFESHFELEPGKQLYVFDYSDYKHDYDMFIKGKYSKFSIKTKDKIIKYFGKIGKTSNYIKSFLYPEDYHEEYAEALEVPIDSIKDVYEVCSIPNMEKETLIEKIPDELVQLKNNSISLDKI